MAGDYYIGIMSGTSMDAIDAVVVDFANPKQAELRASYSLAMPRALQQSLLALCHRGDNEVERIAAAEAAFAEACALVVAEVLAQAQLKATDITAIASHGQTIRHQPQAKPAYTVQIGDPMRLALLTAIPVISEFRRKDILLGGEGAPLVPAYHQAVFARADQPTAILNLGGIANITWLPGAADTVTGFDTGPANTLLDQWYQAHHNGQGFDKGGNWAAQGQVHPQLLARLLSDPYFNRQPPKSTGRDDFHLPWLTAHIQACGDIAATDVQRTLVALSAKTVADAVERFLPQRPQRLYVCGGGALNPLLMEALQQALPRTITLATTEQLGVEPQWVEAMAFAWLGWCFEHKKPGNLPAVTGASRPAILGVKYLPD